MATYTVFDAYPPNSDNTVMYQSGATILPGTPISVTYANPTGTRVVVTGVGFIYDIAGNPTGGTISGIGLFDNTLTIQMVSITGLATSLTAFHAAWLGVGGNADNAAFLLGGGNDVMTGSNNADVLQGHDGNDLIDGGNGDDYIDGYKGNDTIIGGAGSDILSYSWGLNDPAITKGITVDLTKTTVVDPWGFTDTISGIERVRSTRFADTLVGNTADNTFEALAGADTIDGGAGADTVSYSRDQRYGGAKAVTVNLLTGKATDGFGNTDTLISIESARGTDFADTFVGGDTPLPNNGLYGLFGGLGNDTFTAGAGGVYVEPGGGNDTITGGTNTSDQISYQEYTGPGAVSVNLATGISIDPEGGTDIITGGIEGARLSRNNDTFTGDANNNFVRGLAGNDTLDGGGGQDRAMYDRDAQFGGNKGVTINHKTNTAIDGFGNTDTLISIERARGTQFADTWQGGDTPLGLAETYELQALEGNDTIIGGAWDIYVEPGAGNDSIKGGAGIDQISYAEYVGAGVAVFNFATGIINDPYGGTDTMSGIEGARGTANADTFTGNTLANFFRGLDGNDTIDGGTGIDEVRYDRDAQFGGSGAVSVDLTAGTATDGFGKTDKLVSIEDARGTALADLLVGSTAANVLRGLGGADVLDGKGGLDTASYGADAVFNGNGGIIADLASGWAIDGFGSLDTLVSIENISGTNGDNPIFLGFSDVILGSGVANVLSGLGGSDLILAAAGNDSLSGGLAADVLMGDAGADTITGGEGADALLGGTEADTFVIDLAALVDGQGDLIGDFEVGIDSIVAPLSVQAQTVFADNILAVSLAGGGLYYTIVAGATAADIQAATKFT